MCTVKTVDDDLQSQRRVGDEFICICWLFCSLSKSVRYMNWTMTASSASSSNWPFFQSLTKISTRVRQSRCQDNATLTIPSDITLPRVQHWRSWTLRYSHCETLSNDLELRQLPEVIRKCSQNYFLQEVSPICFGAKINKNHWMPLGCRFWFLPFWTFWRTISFCNIN